MANKKRLKYASTSICNYLLVRAKGFEPPTFGTGNQRSIQLSYARVHLNIACLPREAGAGEPGTQRHILHKYSLIAANVPG